MDEQLKQRVVGAVVLVSLGVIFIPMLLRGPSSSGASVPAALALNPQPAPEGFSSRVVPLEGAAVRETQTAGAPRAVAPSPPRPEPVAGPGSPDPVSESPRGWAVQLASFSNPQNALALRDRLKGLGYSAFVASSGEGREKLTRVIVGPVRDRERAQSALGALKLATELSGIVVPYPSE